jgi:iron complex transport system substrate-binding protein
MFDDSHLDQITENIVDACIQIHRDLGPGLFESVYEVLLADELERRGHKIERQKELPLTYRGRILEHAFRIDILVDQRVVIEVKATEKSARIHARQLLTYLRIMRLPVGLVANFGLDRMIDGINRINNARMVP